MPEDSRRHLPRFQGDNLTKNLELIRRLEQVARQKGCTAAQVALAWVLAQGRDIVPIPGTKHLRYLNENVGALSVTLSPEDLEIIDRYFPPGIAAGTRASPSLVMGLS